MGVRCKPEVQELWFHLYGGVRGWETINLPVLPFPGYGGGEVRGLWMRQSISPVCLPSPDSDCTEIKNKFIAARTHLPVMFLATPKDQWSSMWTRERPSAQVSWAICPLASGGCWLGAVLCS